MTNVIGIAAAAAVLLVATSAQAQTYRYKFKSQSRGHGGGDTTQGAMVVKKGPSTSQGYTTYHGYREVRAGKATDRWIASVLGVKTSDGLRFFAAYSPKPGFRLYVFRTSPRGVDVAMIDGRGRWERAARAVGKDLSRGLTIIGKSASGAWPATVSKGRNGLVTWRSGRQVLKGDSCSAGDTIAVAVNRPEVPLWLYCYRMTGSKNLHGTMALPSDDSSSSEDTLTRLP